jgi:hypothetical protein
VLSFHKQTWEEIDSYAERTKADPDEILRTLRNRVCTETFCEREAGGIHGFHAPSLLLSLLLGAESAREGTPFNGSSKKEGLEAVGRALRSMRRDFRVECPPCGRDAEKQRYGEPPATLSALSLFLAQHVEAYRKIVLDAHASANRVALLRGYGNAIVPQVAATFLDALHDVLSY